MAFHASLQAITRANGARWFSTGFTRILEQPPLQTYKYVSKLWSCTESTQVDDHKLDLNWRGWMFMTEWVIIVLCCCNLRSGVPEPYLPASHEYFCCSYMVCIPSLFVVILIICPIIVPANYYTSTSTYTLFHAFLPYTWIYVHSFVSFLTLWRVFTRDTPTVTCIHKIWFQKIPK
jgi:hypothetical protein